MKDPLDEFTKKLTEYQQKIVNGPFTHEDASAVSEVVDGIKKSIPAYVSASDTKKEKIEKVNQYLDKLEVVARAKALAGYLDEIGDEFNKSIQTGNREYVGQMPDRLEWQVIKYRINPIERVTNTSLIYFPGLGKIKKEIKEAKEKINEFNMESYKEAYIHLANAKRFVEKGIQEMVKEDPVWNVVNTIKNEIKEIKDSE